VVAKCIQKKDTKQYSDVPNATKWEMKMTFKNKMFNNDGQPTKRKFRVYCDHSHCKKYIIGKWGGGYGCITTKEGMFDSRNQVWLCDRHSKKQEDSELGRIAKRNYKDLPNGTKARDIRLVQNMIDRINGGKK
jgi:hypothetical protein